MGAQAQLASDSFEWASPGSVGTGPIVDIERTYSDLARLRAWGEDFMLKHVGTYGLVLAMAVTAAGAANAGSANIIVPGGKLDGRVKGAEVYLDTPIEAPVPSAAACQAVKRYLEMISAGDVANVDSLFEEDATHLGALGHQLRGREQIKAFFTGVIGPMKRKVIPVVYGGNDKDCLVVVAVETKVEDQVRWGLTVVDHVTLGNNGKISGLVAYPRGK